MAVKTVTIFPPEPPRRALMQNCEGYAAELVQQLAGNAATYNAMVYGGDTLDSETANPVPVAPGGTGRGHDHSGGLWGPPLYRSLGTTLVSEPETYAAAVNAADYFTATDDPLYWVFDVEPSATEIIESRADLPLTVAGSADSPDFRIPLFVPGCDRGPHGAYNRLYVTMSFILGSVTNMDASDICKVRFRNLHPLAYDEDSQFSVQINSGAWSVSTRYRLQGASSNRLRMIPGAVNIIEPSLEYTASAAAGTRSIALNVYQIEIGVGEIL